MPRFLELQQLKQLQMQKLTNETICLFPECDAFTNAMTRKIEMYAGKNMTWFNAADSRDDDKSRFLVLTSGNCGAIWFASALNIHEEIFTGCGIDHPIESCFLYNLQKDGNDLVAASNQDHYRFGIRTDMHMKDNPMKGIFNSHGLDYQILPRDISKLAWYVFDEIEGMPFVEQRKSLGSIHAFSAEQFANFYKADPGILKQRRVVVANMIRHPLTRIESNIKAFEFYALDQWREKIDAYIDAHLDDFLAIEKIFHVSMEEPRSRAIIATLRMNNHVQWVADELRQFRFMKTFKMETLQSDPDYFANAVTFLTSDRVFADNSYLDQVFSPENLGVGRRCNKPEGTRPPTARDQWEQWSDWMRFEFIATCQKYDVAEAYAEYDYDFSFVRYKYGV